jgi:protein gp37
MADKSHIEWTEATWNPTVGCDKVSPGCAHCYAEVMANRLQAMGKEGYEGVVDDKGRWTGRLNVVERRLLQPLAWKRPRRVFVNSMSDLFHDEVERSTIAGVFGVMAMARQHTFQVLTKRTGRMRSLLADLTLAECLDAACLAPDFDPAWPLKNVWLGVSVEDQSRADERMPALVDTPAARRFVSAEPLLGPVDLTPWLVLVNPHDLEQFEAGEPTEERAARLRYAVHWVIAGGESGAKARPMHPDWARGLRDQCQANAVPFFFKQWGEWLPWDQVINAKQVSAWSKATRDGQQTYFGERIVPGPQGMKTGTTPGIPPVGIARVGKAIAGRGLDGLEWSFYPKGTE